MSVQQQKSSSRIVFVADSNRRLKRSAPSPIEYLKPKDLIEYCLRNMANFTSKRDVEKSREELLEEIYEIRHMFNALTEVLQEQITLNDDVQEEEDEDEDSGGDDEYPKPEFNRFYTSAEWREFYEAEEAHIAKKLRAAEKKALENPKPKSSLHDIKMTLEANPDAERLRTLEIEAGTRLRAAMLKERFKGPSPEVLAAREAEMARKEEEQARRWEKICMDSQTMIFDRPGLSYYKRKDDLQTIALALDLPFTGTVAELYESISAHLEDCAEELEEDPRFAVLVNGNRTKRRRMF